MKETLIVDGYNIIYAWPELERLKESSLDHARSRLISILADYAALTGQRVILVFDAHHFKNTAERSEIIDGVEVIYTQVGESADALIERLVGSFHGQGKVYVATSDQAEQAIIFGRGAYRLTPRELKEQVKLAKKESERFYRQSRPTDGYLENRLVSNIRSRLEKWRRQK
ncbi:MAG TPA: NYN domain-containing protein [Bacillota bacterium]|jgi:predicted RNA-binding protein with PIN domain|nr:NYN domain-containing protein [Peptococcaceae bacterium MAG4]NLW37064.1 NYN domain-containing protein [Peptococcaceae bacterium]HPZ44313.1 NYN domain-containing protein [Bacillota bacterium]HQD77107.1 NYN domain-containing protein [Bacillota bacterium]HUM59637.1 NYN domain-containing protein [Bacillota bacterium]